MVKVNLKSKYNFMKLATISSKNQITLPVDILRALGLKQGSKVLIKQKKKMFSTIFLLCPPEATWLIITSGLVKKHFKSLAAEKNF